LAESFTDLPSIPFCVTSHMGGIFFLPSLVVGDVVDVGGPESQISI